MADLPISFDKDDVEDNEINRRFVEVDGGISQYNTECGISYKNNDKIDIECSLNYQDIPDTPNLDLKIDENSFSCLLPNSNTLKTEIELNVIESDKTQSSENKKVHKISWSDHGMFLNDRLREYYSKQEMCDMIFRLNNEIEIHAHRIVVSAASSVIKRLISTAVENNVEHSIVVIDLDEDPTLFGQLLTFMYGGTLTFTLKEIHALRIMSRKLKIHGMEDIYQRFVLPIENNGEIKCPKLEVLSDTEDYTNETEQRNNAVTVINNLSNFCSICEIDHTSALEYRCHMTEAHGPPCRAFCCSKCGLLFTLKESLIKHSRIHLSQRPAWECLTCNSLYERCSMICWHLKNEHRDANENKVRCSICTSVLSTPASVKEHFGVCPTLTDDDVTIVSNFVHSVIKKEKEVVFDNPDIDDFYDTVDNTGYDYLIPTIDMDGGVGDDSTWNDGTSDPWTTFMSSTNKVKGKRGRKRKEDVHINISKEKLPVVKEKRVKIMPLPDDPLLVKPKLKDGVKKPKDHGNDKRYLCTLCGKVLKGLTSYKRHQVVHTGLRPYPCDVCGKHFRQGSRLTVHKRTHTGERPYLCSLCGKSFRERCKLTKHLLGVHKASRDGTYPNGVPPGVVVPPGAVLGTSGSKAPPTSSSRQPQSASVQMVNSAAIARFGRFLANEMGNMAQPDIFSATGSCEAMSHQHMLSQPINHQ